jgi:L-fuconolactonase
MRKRPAGMIVDAHVHVGPPKYAALPDYRATMPAEGIAGAVLVQHLGNSDNSYLARARAADPTRFAAVAIVDEVGQVDAALDTGFVGLRLSPRGLPVDDGQAVFDRLELRSAAASITGPMEDVTAAEFRHIVREHPSVRFRVEHLGGFTYGSGDGSQQQFARLLALSEEPNVTLMWSGFFLNAGTAWPYPNTHPYLAATLEAFGSNRIMWSGDWNRAGLRPHDYRQAIELVGLVVDDSDQRTDVLSRTAQAVFGLAAPPADQARQDRQSSKEDHVRVR